MSGRDQKHPHYPDEDAIHQEGSSIPAAGDAAPRLSVTHFIETIEKMPRPAATSLPADQHAAPSEKQKERPAESRLEKNWSAGRQVKKKRTVAAPFDITNLKVTPLTAQPMEPVTISFDANNNSDFYCIYPVTIKIDDNVMEAEVISIPPRFTLPMRAVIAMERPGNYRVDVNYAESTFNVIAGAAIDDLFLKDFDMAKLEKTFGDDIEEAGTPVHTWTDELNPRTSKKSRSVIDTAGSGIEIVLDKTGDLLISMMRKIAALFHHRPS